MDKEVERKLLQKWKPVIDAVSNIHEKDKFSVCKHLEHLAIYHSKSGMMTGSGVGASYQPYPTNKTRYDIDDMHKLPMELRIISKLDSLSNIIFINKPYIEINDVKIGISDYTYKFNMERDHLDFLSDLQVLCHIDHLIVEEITNHLNKIIKENNILFVYNLIQSILVDDVSHDKVLIRVISRYKTINN